MEEKKIRVQLFDEESRLISDKLYKQGSELISGPKFTHNGPMRIEITMDNQEDIERAITYIKKLSGMLPLEAKKEKKKVGKIESDSDDYIESMMDMITECKDQDELISNLRNQGFVFVTRDLLHNMERFEKVNWEEEDWITDKYQYMVRLIRESKNPMLDKFDPTLIVGIKIYKKRSDEVKFYKFGELTNNLDIPVPGKAKESFTTQKLHIFPEFMSEKEKERFRREYRDMERDPEKEPTPFYLRWHKWVQTSQPLKQLENYANDEDEE
jgi:hypothetical protein